MPRPSPSRDSARVRRIYEQRPYPPPDRPLNPARAMLVPREWIGAVCGIAAPRRVLVAGCGTGREAFGLRHAYPEAEIVAADFSSRSIAIAREAQRRNPALRDIRFVVADLASAGLRRKTGSGFDFASCHGVLSYIPQPERVLLNLAGCLTPDGALFLGVNGAQHDSVRLRETLPKFGFDVGEFRDGPEIRSALRLCEAISGNQSTNPWAKYPAGLLAGDVFGPLIQNFSLAEWIRRAGRAGWNFRASLSAQHKLRHIWQENICRQFVPRSRGEVCEIAGALQASGFHRLIFTRQPERNPPWEDHKALLEWKPAMPRLYSVRLPRAARGSRNITFKSTAMNTRLDWQIPAWGVEILRRSDGVGSLRDILAGTSAPPDGLRDLLYRLYQLMVLNFTPPDRPKCRTA